jgi:hypothetical protein
MLCSRDVFAFAIFGVVIPVVALGQVASPRRELSVFGIAGSESGQLRTDPTHFRFDLALASVNTGCGARKRKDIVMGAPTRRVTGSAGGRASGSGER